MSTQLTKISNDALSAGGNSRVANAAKLFERAYRPLGADVGFRAFPLDNHDVIGTDSLSALDLVWHCDLPFPGGAGPLLHNKSLSSRLYHGGP